MQVKNGAITEDLLIISQDGCPKFTYVFLFSP